MPTCQLPLLKGEDLSRFQTSTVSNQEPNLKDARLQMCQVKIGLIHFTGQFMISMRPNTSLQSLFQSLNMACLSKGDGGEQLINPGQKWQYNLSQFRI